ncbi:MAG: type IV secretory system conjugative DNA transfer family protein [Lachnospiraceae bacterium]|nr:type IV secretory system conjugative DNA transfer family protein [Lachnospiraceae bacterium]
MAQQSSDTKENKKKRLDLLDRINDILESTAPYYEILQFGFIFIFLFYIIYPRPINLIFFIITVFLMMFAYLFQKDYVKSSITAWRVFIASISLAALGLPLILCKYIELRFSINIPVPIKIMFSVIVFLALLIYLYSDINSKYAFMEEINLKDILISDSLDDNHDVVLCKDKETGKDVIWKKMDRFLHMLVLGPTGCGKTSQIIIPLLIQDIKAGHGVIVLEPKVDLALFAYAISKLFGVPSIYFNPLDPDCPRYNPLDGPEDDVVENMCTIFEMLSNDSLTYYKNIANNLLRNSIKMIKRLEKANEGGPTPRPATLLTLNEVIQNTGGRGRNIVKEFTEIPAWNDEIKKENADIAAWFNTKYYNEKDNQWINSGGVRDQLSNLINNRYLRKVLNPPNGKSDINFQDIVENEGRIFITTNQGKLKNLNKYLGYFLMFSIQAAILGREGNEKTRKPCYWYLDEFQTYANTGLSIILQQGRSYRVSLLLATQSRNAIKMDLGNAGDAFLSVINTNARSQVLFPGLDLDDAKYYSQLFGKEKVKEYRKGESHGASIFSSIEATVSTSESEVDKERFSETDLREKVFKEVTVCRVYKNSVTKAIHGKVDFIDKEMKDELDEIQEVYTVEQLTKRREEEEAIERLERQKYKDYQMKKAGGPVIGTEQGGGEGSISIGDNDTGWGYQDEDKSQKRKSEPRVSDSYGKNDSEENEDDTPDNHRTLEMEDDNGIIFG